MSQKIALAAATAIELEPLLSKLGLPPSCMTSWCAFNHKYFRAVITGAGIPLTAFQLGRFLAAHQPDLLIHIGIAGCPEDRYPIGTVVRVVEDRFADIGAESKDGEFLDMFDLGLWSADQFPWSGKVVSPDHDIWPHANLPTARGITVNLIPGTVAAIQKMENRYDFDIETMEGAAVIHAALASDIPVVCFRGISNVIEPRNRASWDIPGAIASVCETVARLIIDMDDQANVGK